MKTKRIMVATGGWNGLTDLIYDEGFYYLCFRRAAQHMHCRAKIIIFRSRDGKAWEHFSETDKINDIRDPRFTILNNGKLALLANYVRASGGRIKFSAIYCGVIRPGYTQVEDSGIYNRFMSSISDDVMFTYSPLHNADNRLVDFEGPAERRLPSYPDSTEGTIMRRGKTTIAFVRRDTTTSYWIEARSDGSAELFPTPYRVHCPLLILKGNYLLGREVGSKGDHYDWHDRFNQASMWVYHVKGRELIKERQLEGAGDCGYFGFAGGLISYYATPDMTKPRETAIYVEQL